METMNSTNSETINLALREHQANLHDWCFRSEVEDLHLWVERMNLEFRLEIDGVPALQIERLGRYFGHYRRGRNGFGLRDEIAIDDEHVRSDPYWCVLGTLCHELLHCWQDRCGQRRPSKGSRNYHNREFREKAAYLGLVVDQRGNTEYSAGDTPFLNLLRKHGIESRDSSEPICRSISATASKLKLYECPCGVKVRVGRSRFHAKCLDCGGLFEKKG